VPRRWTGRPLSMTEIKRGPMDYLVETVLAYIRENGELRAKVEELSNQPHSPPGSFSYPPVSEEELRNCHSFSNLTRVVVGKTHVYGMRPSGEWIILRPSGAGIVLKPHGSES
jgi:hypothetical protein